MLLGDKSKSVAIDGVPVGVSGEAEGAAAGIARTAATEKTAGISCHLIADDRHVLKDALLQNVVVRVSDGSESLSALPYSSCSPPSALPTPPATA